VLEHAQRLDSRLLRGRRLDTWRDKRRGDAISGSRFAVGGSRRAPVQEAAGGAEILESVPRTASSCAAVRNSWLGFAVARQMRQKLSTVSHAPTSRWFSS
jgi:hypothetical protein